MKPSQIKQYEKLRFESEELNDSTLMIESLNPSQDLANFLSNHSSDDMKKVNSIVISNSGCESLPTNLVYFSSRDSLTIVRSGLRNLQLNQELTRSFRNLQQVVLRQNRIEEFTWFGSLPELKTLDLSGNYIQELSGEVSKCRGLTYLDVSANFITALPPELFGLEALREFKISWGQSISPRDFLAELRPLVGRAPLRFADFNRVKLGLSPESMLEKAENFASSEILFHRLETLCAEGQLTQAVEELSSVRRWAGLSEAKVEFLLDYLAKKAARAPASLAKDPAFLLRLVQRRAFGVATRLAAATPRAALAYTDASGQNAFHMTLASDCGPSALEFLELAARLLPQAANNHNADGLPPIFIAVRRKNLEAIEFVRKLKAFDPVPEDVMGRQMLHAVAETGSVKFLTNLLVKKLLPGFKPSSRVGMPRYASSDRLRMSPFVKLLVKAEEIPLQPKRQELAVGNFQFKAIDHEALENFSYLRFFEWKSLTDLEKLETLSKILAQIDSKFIAKSSSLDQIAHLNFLFATIVSQIVQLEDNLQSNIHFQEIARLKQNLLTLIDVSVSTNKAELQKASLWRDLLS